MNQWIEITPLKDIPVLGSRIVETEDANIAVFRGNDDQVYAVKDACPHKQGPLSQGIMHDGIVTCPLHNWKINLTNGEAQGPDSGCVNVYPIKVEDGQVFLKLQSEEPEV